MSSPSLQTPRVSIGMPVYNAERYIARSIQSILAQSFTDFELIITDNGSRDTTESICRDFAARDPRIRYFRADTNQGVVRNFNWCFELSRGEYFHWNAGDDMIAPSFLEQLVEVLDADRDVVLAFARSRIVDESDQTIRINDYDSNVDHPNAAVRFWRMMNIDHHRHCAQEVYGLIRRTALGRTPLYQPVVRTDSVLLVRLALLGRFRAVDEPLFLNREHGQRSVALVPGEKARRRSRLSRWIGVGPIPPAEFWHPSLAGKIIFPEWQILRQYALSLRLAPPTLRDRFFCVVALLAFSAKHLPKLARDLLIASEHLIMGFPKPNRPMRSKITPASA